MSSGHYCDGCAQAYYKCVCNKPQEKVKEQTIKMNERIKELAEQAGLVRNGDFGMKRWEGPRSDSISDQDLEKFAQLIVRECTAVLFDESERLSGLSLNEDNWDYAEEYEVCSNQCINDIALIEKHFGVEE